MNEKKHAEKHRLTLIESYCVFSDKTLKSVADKIKNISSFSNKDGVFDGFSDTLQADVITHKSNTETPFLPKTKTLEERIDRTPNGQSNGQSNETPIGQSITSNRTPIGTPIGQSNGTPNEQSNGTPNEQSNGTPNETFSHSSSSYINKETTTVPNHVGNTEKNVGESLEEEFEYNNEFGYWRQKGLTTKQILGWMKKTGCGLTVMIRSLSHCRFEMVDLGMEESKPIDNVFNWFYRILERTGSYPAPKGYKPLLERQIEQERRLLEETEKKRKEFEALHRKTMEKKREYEFWEMMNYPEGDQYKECYARLSTFEKRLESGTAFEASMMKAFDEILKKRDQEEYSSAGDLVNQKNM